MNFRRTTPIISSLVILIILLTTVTGAEPIRSLDDLDGKRIAVALGSFQEKPAEQKYKNAKILSFPSFSDCANAVLANKADACLFNSDGKNDLLKARPELTALPESAYDFTCAAAFRKGNDSLRTEFNAFLKKICDDGTYQEIADRWLNSDDSKKIMPPIENDGRNGTLKSVFEENGKPSSLGTIKRKRRCRTPNSR